VILLAVLLTLNSSHAQTKDLQHSNTRASQSYTPADVKRALERAEQCAREGNYAEALRLHIWYHKNALKYDPAQYGVRLSFALSDWADLARAYPPALHALLSIRNQTLTTYGKDPSDAHMYGEVLSIDLALDDLPSAKTLFYQGRKSGVRDTELLFELNRILQAGDVKWAGDVIGDPVKKLDEIKADRELSLSALTTRKDLAKELDHMFATQIANLLKAVAKVHGLPAAQKLQKSALKLLDSPVIRSAVHG